MRRPAAPAGVGGYCAAQCAPARIDSLLEIGVGRSDHIVAFGLRFLLT